MFSQTSEYVLRVVVFLASQGDAPATTQQIAAATHVPAGYLSKLLQGLGRAGIVRSQRGLHGGSVLARSAEGLSVFDVIAPFDPVPRIRTCPLGLKSHGVNLCPLHRRLDDAMTMVEKAFRDSTIADLLREPTTSTPLCETPELAADRQAKATPVTVAGRKAPAARKR